MKKKRTKELPEHVYNHLDKFGNTIISQRIVDMFGEKKIIQMLKKRGYETQLIVTEDFSEEYNSTFPRKGKKNFTYLLEVKERISI